MKQLYTFVAVAATVFSVSARTITIVNEEKKPVAGAVIVMYGEKNDSISTARTDSLGRVDISMPPVASFTVEAEGYTARLLYAARLESDKVVIDTGHQLDELVVDADAMKSHLTHTTYRLSKEEMQKYNNFFECLDAIPLMTVLPGSSSIYYKGRSDIALLVDGVPSDNAEIKTISKNDISKIDVYDTPPQQYADQGYTTVVDIITKSGLRGGTAGIDVNQSPWPLTGANAASVYYNYKRSKWSLLYTNDNSRYDDVRYNQDLDYEFDGVRYDKHKDGMKSKSRSGANNLRLGFQTGKTYDYLYNVRLGGSLVSSKRNYMQDVETAAGTMLEGENHLSTDAKNVTFENYFEKYLGEKGRYGNISADVLYTHRNTSYSSFYREHGVSSDGLVNSQSDYDLTYNSVMAWLSYYLPYMKWGSTSVSVTNDYRESSYDDNQNPMEQKTNSLHLTLRHFYRANSWLKIQPAVGVLNSHIVTNGQKENKWTPYAQLQFNFDFPNGIGGELSYSYMETNPSIGQLSETDQWLDTRLVYHGNPDLRSYSRHNISLNAYWFKNRFVKFSLNGSYDNMPGYILDHYVLTDRYYLQTLENMKRYSELRGTLSLWIYPLGTRDFYLTSQLVGGKIWGKGSSYEWTGYRYLWNVSAVYRIRRWTVMGTYSYPGKLAEGQLVMPQPEWWKVVVQYRPSDNVSLGLDWVLPFAKSYVSGERTVAEAPVHVSSFVDNRSFCNFVRVQFSWNFQFGKKRNNDKPSINISDTDTGILVK